MASVIEELQSDSEPELVGTVFRCKRCALLHNTMLALQYHVFLSHRHDSSDGALRTPMSCPGVVLRSVCKAKFVFLNGTFCEEHFETFHATPDCNMEKAMQMYVASHVTSGQASAAAPVGGNIAAAPARTRQTPVGGNIAAAPAARVTVAMRLQILQDTYAKARQGHGNVPTKETAGAHKETCNQPGKGSAAALLNQKYQKTLDDETSKRTESISTLFFSIECGFYCLSKETALAFKNALDSATLRSLQRT